MKRTTLVAVLMATILVSSVGRTQSPFSDYCTTTEKIQFLKTHRIPSALGPEQVREAILVALGSADVEVSWARDTFAGQWFFEYQDDPVIYAGYSVRSHYLQVAILLDKDSITTVVCDSRNLNQSEKKIHRKVPGWKGTLDDDLRIAMGQAAEYYRQITPEPEDNSLEAQLGHLNVLHEAGVLTEQEYRDMRQRILGN